MYKSVYYVKVLFFNMIIYRLQSLLIKTFDVILNRKVLGKLMSFRQQLFPYCLEVDHFLIRWNATFIT